MTDKWRAFNSYNCARSITAVQLMLQVPTRRRYVYYLGSQSLLGGLGVIIGMDILRLLLC